MTLDDFGRAAANAVRPLVLVLGLAGALAVAPVQAAPTGQVEGGATIVRFSDTFLGALKTLGVAVAPEQKAFLKGRYAAFPIPAGALDLESLAGDVLHSGGLSLEAGGTEVELLSFIIDTNSLAQDNAAADQPILTGLVVVNGDTVGRVALFNLSLNQAPAVSRGGRVVIRDVDIRLTAGAAEALNGIFGVSAFTEGLSIGQAQVRTWLEDRRYRRWGWKH